MYRLALFLPLCLSAHTFFDLSQNLNNQEVTIRGFLYQAPSGDWVLAAQPNLPTCCQKLENKIFLHGPVNPTSTIAEVTGRFFIQPIYSNNELIQLYHINLEPLESDRS